MIKQQEQDGSEDELSPEQPKFTIAVDGDVDDESSLMDRPRLSMPLEEVEETAKSVEVPRRVASGDEQGRLSRGSFGSLRGSDRFGVPDNSNIDASYGEPMNDQEWQEIDNEFKEFPAARELESVPFMNQYICLANA